MGRPAVSDMKDKEWKSGAAHSMRLRRLPQLMSSPTAEIDGGTRLSTTAGRAATTGLGELYSTDKLQANRQSSQTQHEGRVNGVLCGVSDRREGGRWSCGEHARRRHNQP